MVNCFKCLKIKNLFSNGLREKVIILKDSNKYH